MNPNSTEMIQNLLNQCQPLEPEDRIHMLLRLLNKEVERQQASLSREHLKCYGMLLGQVIEGLGLGILLENEEQENIFNTSMTGKNSKMEGSACEDKHCKAIVVIKKQDRLNHLRYCARHISHPCFITGMITVVLTIMVIGVISK